jgi:hypothetical protein
MHWLQIIVALAAVAGSIFAILMACIVLGFLKKSPL